MRHDTTPPRMSGIPILPLIAALIGTLLISPAWAAGGRGPGRGYNTIAYTASTPNCVVATKPAHSPRSKARHRGQMLTAR